MDNIIVVKSKKFALRIIKLYRFLSEKSEFVLSRQILKSGTSIGANVNEAICAQSESDFYAKMYIAYKEAQETKYWLELLHESGYIDTAAYESVYDDCLEIVKILSSITKAQKSK